MCVEHSFALEKCPLCGNDAFMNHGYVYEGIIHNSQNGYVMCNTEGCYTSVSMDYDPDVIQYNVLDNRLAEMWNSYAIWYKANRRKSNETS